MWLLYENFFTMFNYRKYEFDKHGKCALQDPLIRDQYGYFKFGIDLMKGLNLLE
ncbi:uncharacterized protein DC041_0012425 [Schistosoma bovis]|uniref:Uncharacterized protein n=1 Tax=Schistosoma bovis TaxID=6184 RepID=A0A430PX20_SCHBO|nr:uncharacterized protein DC041_0012425 [Schistosoma bovis]